MITADTQNKVVFDYLASGDNRGVIFILLVFSIAAGFLYLLKKSWRLKGKKDPYWRMVTFALFFIAAITSLAFITTLVGSIQASRLAKQIETNSLNQNCETIEGTIEMLTIGINEFRSKYLLCIGNDTFVVSEDNDNFLLYQGINDQRIVLSDSLRYKLTVCPNSDEKIIFRIELLY